MELIIGRDAESSQLKISADKQSKLFGAKGSVPGSVSRQHCSLTINADNTYLVKNIKAQNATYVNGVAVESKVVKEGDSIELGVDHYMLEWSFVNEMKPKMADIRPLKKVWEDYNLEKKRIREKQKTVGLLASVPMGISMFGGLVTAIIPGIFTIAFTAIAFLIMLYGLYRRATDKSAEELEELNTKMQRDYSCPNCRRYLGQPFEQLMLMDNCPYCRTMFRK